MKKQKHLNVERNEAVKVIVNFELNKFVIYLQLTSGSNVVFLTSDTAIEFLTNEEFKKYVEEWSLDCEYSDIAKRMYH